VYRISCHTQVNSRKHSLKQTDDNTTRMCTHCHLVRVLLMKFCYLKSHTHTHTHTHATVLWFYGFLVTRRSIHPLIPIVVINCPLSALSIYYDPWHLPCSIHAPDSLFPQSLSTSFLWSTSWPGTLHFILHTLLHPIIVIFSQHMPIPLHLISL